MTLINSTAARRVLPEGVSGALGAIGERKRKKSEKEFRWPLNREYTVNSDFAKAFGGSFRTY